ncbi:hypothetical protein [Candidatus Finniella inopinata]|uniref:Peptidase M15C domain-containing protein n=1 Tax=Candidatus Finniella inopinata TaxID=1696036 RepID=A0A4Q7DGW8_9PROT|nr:hypothetical protein [Candidatus Finniella inopinata]RZI45530.1 hypothetical protein EQU50_06870 [Candidatus Finniella inopinata]
MLLKSFFNYLPMAALALGTYSVSFAGTYQDETAKSERNKTLVLINLKNAQKNRDIRNDCLNARHPDEPILTYEQHIEEAKRFCARSLQREAAKTPAQKEAEQRKWREAEEKRTSMIQEIESEIHTKIEDYSKKHPAYQAALTAIDNAQGHECYWADVAAAIGTYFRNLGRTDDADYFYDLSKLGTGRYTQNHGPSSQGRMNIKLCNQELAMIRQTGGRPTTYLLQKLEKVISAFCYAEFCNDEVAEFALFDLQKYQNMLVRWHLSNPYVSTNPTLKKIAYGYGFIEGLLNQVDDLTGLISCTHYNGSMDDGDLAKKLIDLGFWGIKQSNQQHNWVHKGGMMIRVKRLENNKPQLTIGITVHSPLEWGEDGIPTNLARYSDGSLIAFDEHNEVFKLAYDHGAISVVPSRIKIYDPHARRKVEVRNRWYKFGFCGEMMDEAHFELDGYWDDATNYFDPHYPEHNLLSFRR